ncbi:MAG: ROK family protein [Longicatena sp.]|nr:ROK family protein [Longicatena sp.]
MKYALGIDIGGTNTRVALVDEQYNILNRIQFSTDADNPENTLEKIKETIIKFGNYDIVGIGMSCPGPLDLIHGKVLMTPNLHEKWWHYPIVAKLTEVTGLKTYLENDANLACLAEACVGQGKDYRYVSFMTISTGVGAGFCIDKEIYQGAHGFGHEIANMLLWMNGPSHGTIVPGGIEAICSGTAIENRARKEGLEVNHAGDVYTLAQNGNAIAAQIIDDAKEYLANGISIIYGLLDPEIVVLGGSVALKIPNFVEDVAERVKYKVFDVVKPYVKIVKTNLSEDSGLLGAASLAFLKNK